MKSSDDAHLLSGAYALDAVSSEEAAEFEAEMRSSEELRGEIAGLTDTAVVLGLSVPPAEPPPALRARLLDLIDTAPQLPAAEAESAAPAESLAVAERMPSGAHQAPHRIRRRRPVLLLAIAAVAVLLFGGGLLADRMMLSPGSSQTTSALTRITTASDVQRTEAAVAGGGTATVYWSHSVNESAVVLNGVQRPADHSLQMWVVTGATATSVGLFDPPAGRNYEVMKGALDSKQHVAVTVEPAGGSAQPTTKPIVVLPTA
ncbi:MAG TPA: anti-sigma factor [Amnibacterium sp.]|jgi:anti-sigma-K factor RskA